MRQAPELTHEARVLRQSAEAAERLLWPRLRNRRLDNHKIRRARPIGDQVVSFYCAEARLAIQIERGAVVSGRMRDMTDAHSVSLLALDADAVLGAPEAALETLRTRLSQ